MEQVEKYLNRAVNKLYKSASAALSRGKLEDAMSALSVVAGLLYDANTRYTDDAGEELLSRIARQLPAPHIREPRSGGIVFYDGFGLNNRGLIQIYLKGLVGRVPLTYVTHIRNQNALPDVLNILEKSGAKVCWLTANTHLGLARELLQIFCDTAPEKAFLYTTPNDVAALSAFRRMEGQTHRYQINLTDHAYWLGIGAFDTCIEFRDYGASISRDKRRIPAQQLVKLPFYPAIDFSAPFQGYPFAVAEGAKIVFSGGSLYKTLGGNNRYYETVDFILREFPEAIFWYAGQGDSTQLDILIKAYPGRIFHTAERSDLYQVLKHSFLYLSTYPVCGGLMFQYAASAGKIPVTLRYDDVSDDFLLDQDDLGIQFLTMDSLKEELRKLFTDDDYRCQKEERVKAAVLDRGQFESSLNRLLTSGDTGFAIRFKETDTAAFLREYLKNLSRDKVAQRLVSKKNMRLARYMPMRFLRGAIYKVKCRLEKLWK